jgi:nicotinate phosphoribosyltransferase
MADKGTFVSGPVALTDAALLTDLYEITMAASYLREAMHGPATFSLFVRRLPPDRSFLVAAGLEDVVRYLESFRFSPRALDYLRGLERFDPAFLTYLEGVRFTGQVRAVAEGTLIFPNEPLLEVTAPVAEAQLVETAVLNACHAQTVVASKAARVVLAARGRPVVEFGLRRAPGLDAGLKAARSAFIVGAASSSNVLAGQVWGIPPTGTMAHSYVSAFATERDSFRAFARAFPRQTILLIDTYDTIAGAHAAAEVGQEMAARGQRLAGVRLDSGDLAALAPQVRRILDEAGLLDVKLFASGGLDEYEIDRCLTAGAPIDAFGVGTKMDVSADAPYLDMAYKLVSYNGRPVLKTSVGKTTWTGAKQVFRRYGADGQMAGDVVGLADEAAPDADAEALLRPVMRAGGLLEPMPTLAAIRARYAAQLAALPAAVRRLHDAAPYAVRFSDRLVALQRAVERDVASPAFHQPLKPIR